MLLHLYSPPALSSNNDTKPQIFTSNNSNNLNHEVSLLHSSFIYALCITALLSTLCLITLIGNSLVVLAVLTTRALHTVTNSFIMSLGVADMLVSILVMPLSIYMVIFEIKLVIKL